jgi:hypothetical protein
MENLRLAAGLVKGWERGNWTKVHQAAPYTAVQGSALGLQKSGFKLVRLLKGLNL